MDIAAFSAIAALGTAIAYTRTRAHTRTQKKDTGAASSHEETLARLGRKYGLAIRRCFALNFDDFVHLNHGSYGTAPFPVLTHAHTELMRIEAFPDDWFRRRALVEYTRVCNQIAKFIGGEPGSTVLLENATLAVNTVLRSLCVGVSAGGLQPGDVCVINDNTYNACKNAVMDACERTGATLHTLNFRFPVTSESELLEDLRAGLRQAASKGRVRFVLLDHITSPTAVVMPVAAMTRICQEEYGAEVMIDGAHAPGQLHLDMRAIGAEWYTGNLHKWCFTMKGCAVLYTAPRKQAMTQSIVISHFWKRPYMERFFMQGTNDQSRYMSVPAALEFMGEALGGVVSMRAYNTALGRVAANMLAARWGTSLMVPEALCAPFLVSVEAPLSYRDFTSDAAGKPIPGIWDMSEEAALAAAAADPGINERVAQSIFTVHGIQSQFFLWTFGGKGKLFCRISAQVYNTLADYERLADAVLRLAREKAAARML